VPNNELRVQIVDASNRAINNYVSSSGTHKRYVGYAVISSGTYYIKVYSNTLSGGREYTLNLSVASPSVRLVFDTVAQEQTYWCWAASAKMAGEFYWKLLNSNTTPLRTVTQSQIVQAVHGNTNNSPAADISEVRQALNYALEGSVNSGASSYSSGYLTKNAIFERLWTFKQPIIVRVGIPNSNVLGHAIVMRGIEIASDYTDVWIKDPNMNDGSLGSGIVAGDYSVSLNDLYNVGYMPNSNRVWTHTVTFNRVIQ
jgi:hypothetical protein